MFLKSREFLDQNVLKETYDFLLVDFHGEITSEKMAIRHVFDGHNICSKHTYSCAYK